MRGSIICLGLVLITGSTGSTGSAGSAEALAKAEAHLITRERRRATGSQDEIQLRMRAWSAALGVTCAHCHVPEAWTDSSKPAFEFAQRMARMAAALNAGPLKELGGVTCWTCHRGRTVPARLPRSQWEDIQARHSAEFASNPSRALAMSVYSASLGVDCMHCHEPETWEASSKRGFAMVNRMLPIFDEIPRHFDKLRMPQTQCYMCHQGNVKPER